MKRRAQQISGKAPREFTYTVVTHPGDRDQGGFWAEVPALTGCNTQGETYEETVANARVAIEGYLRMLLKVGETIPIEKQPKQTVVTAVKVAL